MTYKIEQPYRNLRRLVWTGIAIAGLAIFGKVGLQLASLPLSPRVPEQNVERFVNDIAEQHNFDETIEVVVHDSYSTTANYDLERGVNVIKIGRPCLRESAIRHEAKHVVDGHVKHDRTNFFQREYDEWVATFYGVGILK